MVPKQFSLIFSTVVLVSILLKARVTAAQDGETESQILDRILRNYSNIARPPGKGPTIVLANIYLRSLDAIDDSNRELSVQVTLRQEWKDDRLKFRKSHELKKGYVGLQNVRMVWLPDLFFRNEKRGHNHDITGPNVFVRIFPDGNVLYSIRISLTLSCPMQLNRFPFDTQNCTLRMASYGMATEDILYKWKIDDPVQISTSLDLNRFSLTKFETGNCDTKTNTGLYSCLRLDLLFKREFSYYFVQVYIPCISLVILAWLPFWLDPKDIVARLAIAVPTYLILAVGTSLLNQTFPKTSYTKAIDTWTGICLTFVFGALFETIIANFIQRRIAYKTRDGNDERQNSFEEQTSATKLDIVFRGLYPILFVIFMGIYFAVY